MEWVRRRWQGEAGYGRLLKIAFPLILSTGSHSVMMTIDRILLSWHSTDSIAAAVPAALLNFAILCFFLGTAMYTSTFVAQYIGAGRPERVGPALWQGLRIAAAGGIVLPLIGPFAPQIFALVGHDPSVQAEEVIYFRILNIGAFFFLSNAVLSCFYSGRGQTWPVMWINVGMATLNAILDYGLILGKLGLPRLGIQGAGIATVVSTATFTCLYAYLVFRKRHNSLYATRSAWRLEKPLFLRMLRFGAPSGVHFFLDLMGFTLFVLIIGRIGKTELAASNMAQQINLLGLLPMIGMGIATTIMVGQFQGAKRSDLAERATYSALQLALLYSATLACLYVFLPDLLLAPFAAGGALEDAPRMREISSQILRYMAVIILLDTVAIATGATLKGAGDTRFVMYTLAFTSTFCLVIPVYIAIEVLQLSIYHGWLCMTVNMSIVASIFFARFLGKRWQSIEVIESESPEATAPSQTAGS